MTKEWVAAASFAQERVWLDCQAAPDLTAYNLVTTADLPGDLSQAQVEQMLVRLVERQEGLRTSLQLRDGELMQVVAAELPVPPLPVTDLSAAPPAQQERRVGQICDVEAATAFDLATAPLWRARLVRLSTGWQLVFAVHHAIYDGGSATVLYAELGELAAAARERREPRLPELEIQYADFAAWQRGLVAGDTGRQQLAYWLRQLAGAPPVHAVPLDYPRPPEQAHEGDDVFFTLPPGTGHSAQSLARAHGATELAVMLAGYVALLAEASGEPDVVVGVPAMGRDRAELRPLIGMFVNTLVIRVDAGGDPRFVELLGRVRDRLFEAWDNQDLPIQTLVKHLVSQRDPSYRPLYQLGFNHLKSFDRGRAHGVARDELLLVAADDEGRIEYRTDLFRRETVERLAERYVSLINQVLADPQLRLSELAGGAPFAAGSRSELGTGDVATGQEPAPAVAVAAGAQRYPVSFSQERMWVLERLAPGDPVYHMPLALRLRGELSAPALQQALDTVVARHGALRTTFGELEGEPYQLIWPAEPTAILVEDLTAVAADERLSVAREVTAAEARAPFDLTTGPLLRVKLLRLADDDHFLLLTMHHIIADGWSIGLLAAELSEAYRAGASGEAPQLPELPLGYGDYATWQRQQLAGEELTRQLDYWREHLSGAPALLELPTEQPRPVTETFAGDRCVFPLPESLRDQVGQLAARTDTTQFMVMLAALQVTLARYTGQRDIVVGTPIAGRTHAELDQLIGLFVNTLALRGQLTGNPSFREVLAQAREATLAGLSNQELPFEKLVETLQPERSLSHSPVFQVQLIVQNTPPAELRLPGLALTAESRHTRSAKFDLTVEVVPLAGGATGIAVEYKTDLFSADWARRFAGCLTEVLQAVTDNVDRAVFDIDLLPAGQRDEVIAAPNRTAAPVSADSAVGGLVAALAAAGTVAVGEAVTPLPAVGEHAARLATVLVEHGVGPDALVGLCVDRSAGMLAGMLGVWRAGGAYVPLDPAFPADRLRMMVADSGLRVIVTDEAQHRLAAQLAGPGVVVLRLDGAAVADAAPQPRPVPVRGDNLAYVIYTSGSTGRPKGVEVPHRPVVNLLDWFAGALRLTESDTLVAVTTLSFDIAVLELLLPLWSGCRLVIATQEQSTDPRLLRRLLDDAQATVVQATPATWRMLVSAGGVPAWVRTRLCGGEALPPDLADELVGPEIALWNVYGPTETTVWSAAGQVTGSPPQIEVGPPLGNTALYVLDPRLLPVPLGVVGEVYIGGEGLTRGYHGRPGLTAERFVPDPFAGFAGARMYRTGDLARRLANGRLEFLGRADNQVKVRGFRIETGEIETVLAEHPAVSQAVVTADTSAGETRLVGYLVAVAVDATPAQLWPQLRPHLRASLPDYMLPATLVVLPELPLTPNGKIDRRALPAPTWGATSTVSHVAPRTEVEEKLAAAWAQLLAITEPIGVHDDFFTLGGHSLTATRLVARIRGMFGPQLSLRDVFAGATIAELATAIVAHPDYGRAPAAGPAPLTAVAPASPPSSSAPTSPAPPGPPAAPATPAAAGGAGLSQLSDQDIEALLAAALRERESRQAAAEPLRYPLSPFQRRLWFLQQLAPDEPLYTVHNHWPLGPDVDPAVVQRVADALVARHPALRTTFAVVDDEPVQVVAPPGGSAELTVVDVSGQPAAHRADAAQRAFAEELQRPFDLTNGPLVRLRLLRAGDEHVLLMNLHHLIADATSVELLRSEFARCYREETEGVAAALPPLPTSYGEYARAETDAVGEQRLAEQLEYWRTRLAGAPALLELPTDRPRPAVQTFHGGSYERPLTAEVTSALLASARREGSTPYPTVLAAFQLLLARYSGQREVLVGTAVTRRPTEELEQVVGLFVNTVVARADLSGNPTLRELVAATRAEHVAALSNADVPFDRVAEALRPDRSAAYSPVFQVMFVYNDAPQLGAAGGADVGLDDLGQLRVPVPAARFDLTLSVGQRRGRFQLMFDFNQDLFDESSIAAMADQLARLLAAFTTDPEQRSWDVPLLTAEHREQLVLDRQPVRAYPQRFVPDLVAAVAASNPAAPALLSEGETLRYGELTQRAGQLTRRLRALGVGPDQRVGLAVPAGADALVAVLGIMQAGGAYLPLDPGHPVERLRWIVADAGVQILVTTAGHADQFAGLAGTVVLLDELPSAPGPVPPAAPLHPLNAAYVIYTSGSTGAPKGVVVSHAGLSNLTQSFVDLHGFTAADRLLMIPPMSFDASVGDIFPALVSGAALVLHPEPATLAGKDLLRICAEQGITAVDAPSALWQQWVDDLAAGELCDPGPLRQLMVGGEAVPVPKAAGWARATGGAVRLVNHYGPTEATVCATTYATVDGAEVAGAGHLPAGTPVPNVRCYVLDERLQPLPDGVPGELCLGGAGVARGYLGRPGLTAERFVPDPFSEEPGARLYRTGDRARWHHAAGSPQLEFLGRTDAQVKIRGHRVELREVEAAITSHPEVREAAVVARAGVGGDRLIGYVAPHPAAELSAEALRDHLRERLPEYLLPARLLLLESLPLTSHGKVDRTALPEPAADDDRPAYTAPVGPTESVVAEVWAEVLELPGPVGRHDSFFALGGHSLLAITVATRLGRRLGHQPSPKLLFQAETLAELAQLIDRSGSAPGAVAGATPDLRAEANLPDDVCANLAPFRPGPLSRVLLTGATGFLGAYLLDDLLRHTEATVYCLVRAGSTAAGAERIEQNLRRYQLWRPELAGRIIPVAGDLAEPGLGWSADQFATLAEQLDAIYHNGGLVNFLQPYEWLRPANVAGTEAVLRLAGAGRTTPVHFVSTLGVFLSEQYRSGQVSEADVPAEPVGMTSAYNQSKWVADAMVRAAAERGLPVTIHRPARISGDSRTGATNVDDYFSRLLKTYVQLGSVPLWEAETDLYPVDSVSATIGYVSRQLAAGGELPGGGLHYFNNATISFDEIAVTLRRAGFPVRRLGYPQWREELMARVSQGEELALASFAPLMPEEEPPDSLPRFDCSRAQGYAAAAGVPCPPADGALLRRYVDYFVQTGYLTRPGS